MTTVHAKAITPAVHEAWFALVANVVEKYHITPENTFGADEFGLIFGTHQRNRVIAARGLHQQHEQSDPSCDFVTVLTLTCADGKAFPPLVVFKARSVHASWGKNNPLKST